MSAVQAIPLGVVRVCPDCNVAIDAQECPYCLTQNLGFVANWLNRKKPVKRAK